jgi:cobalt-zinc-cadmium efflux system outer membrane protein
LPDVALREDELFQAARRRRQEVRLARVRVERTGLAIRLGEVMGRPRASRGYSFFERAAGPEAGEGPSRPPYGLRAKAPDRPDFARNEAYLAQMRQNLEAERARLGQALAETDALVRAGLERLDQARRQLDLVRGVVLPQDQSAYDVMLSQYQSGRSGFLDLLDAERALVETRLERERARRDLNHSILRLAAAVGRF